MSRAADPDSPEAGRARAARANAEGPAGKCPRCRGRLSWLVVYTVGPSIVTCNQCEYEQFKWRTE
jgi:hypothetical protein